MRVYLSPSTNDIYSEGELRGPPKAICSEGGCMNSKQNISPKCSQVRGKGGYQTFVDVINGWYLQTEGSLTMLLSYTNFPLSKSSLSLYRCPLTCRSQGEEPSFRWKHSAYWVLVTMSCGQHLCTLLFSSSLWGIQQFITLCFVYVPFA